MDIKFTWHTSWYNKTDDIDSLFLVQEWMQIKIVYVKSEETGIHWMKMEYVEWPMNGSINWIEMFIRQSKNIEKKKLSNATQSHLSFVSNTLCLCLNWMLL